MLEEEFEMWFADLKTKETLVKLNLHISTLGYLKEGPLYFVKLPDSSTKENRQIVGLDTATTIIKNN